MPTFSARGTIVHLTGRCLRDHVCNETVLFLDKEGKPVYCPKYKHFKGLDGRLYNVSAVQHPGDTIHLTEGQLDAATLVACGLPAVGIPGAQAWKPHAWRLFQGFDRVCFWADQDDKGASMVLFESIRRRLPAAEVVQLPHGHDLNSFYVEQGKDAVLSLATGADGDESYIGSNTEDEVFPTEGEFDEPVIHFDEDGEVIPF